MAGEPGATEAPRPPADEGSQGQGSVDLGELERDALLEWVGENLTLVRRTASGQRVSYRIFGVAFAVGLAAHICGFLLKTSVTTEPLMLFADLLHALGWSLWTGVVVVVFVQIWPRRPSAGRVRSAPEGGFQQHGRLLVSAPWGSRSSTTTRSGRFMRMPPARPITCTSSRQRRWRLSGKLDRDS